MSVARETVRPRRGMACPSCGTEWDTRYGLLTHLQETHRVDERTAQHSTERAARGVLR